MKEFRLIKWYPSLPTEWYSNDFTIVVVQREDGYHLHPSLKGKTRFAVINEREVDRNNEFWEELIPNTYTTVDGQPIKEGDKFYMYDSKNFKCIQAKFGHYTNKKYDGKRYRTQEEVENLIELNKIQYRLKDIVKVVNKISHKLHSKEEILNILAGKENIKLGL